MNHRHVILREKEKERVTAADVIALGGKSGSKSPLLHRYWTVVGLKRPRGHVVVLVSI